MAASSMAIAPLPTVDFAHNDADAMKRYVVEALGYRPGDIIDLRDATKIQIDAVLGNRETHKGKLYNWVRAGRPDVVVFYSGHGVPGRVRLSTMTVRFCLQVRKIVCEYSASERKKAAPKGRLSH